MCFMCLNNRVIKKVVIGKSKVTLPLRGPILLQFVPVSVAQIQSTANLPFTGCCSTGGSHIPSRYFPHVALTAGMY